MKTILCSLAFTSLCLALHAQGPDAKSAATNAAPKLSFNVYDWEKMKVTPTTNGMRRTVCDGSTATLDKLHCHISTLNPGQVSGEPRLHLQEEITIIKEGTIEATCDGKTQTGRAGSVIFFPSHAVTRLRNVGTVPATYTVVYYFTPLTPKN